MTCQWCKHYRRRCGVPMCALPSKDGKGEYSDIKKHACERFDARRSCTTCEYRCPQDERDMMMSSREGCPKWRLRELSTWGGARRFARS